MHFPPPKKIKTHTIFHIKIGFDIFTVISSFVQEIPTQFLVELREIFEEPIKHTRNEIITHLKNALHLAIKNLGTKLSVERDSLQQPL